MARVEPGSATRSGTESFLGLSGGALTTLNASVFNSSTNFGSIKQSVFVGAGQTVTAYWNYVSQDYSPFNDGIFATLVGPGGYQQIKLLAVTDNAYGTPGVITTGSFGSTGWHSVSFTAGAAGNYTLGMGCFNTLDHVVHPLLFIDNAAGGTSAPGQPVVTTTVASSVTASTAVTGGNVTSDGGAAVTARGVVYGTSPVPTLANGVTVNGSGLGAFTSSLSGLSGSTTYYVRSYATNSAGTSYGNEVSFTTPSACTPTSFTSCPSNMTANTDANSCDAVVNYMSSASNAPVYSYTLTGATSGSGNGNGSGAAFNKGVTTVTVTATNACGTDQCSFTVTVNDATNPVLSIPADATVNCQDDNTTTALGTATATDNCGAVTVTYSDASTQNASNTDAGHYNYTIVRTWTATDASNNSVSADQTITVQDVTAPSVSCPANATVSCKTSVADNGTATGSDNCSPVTITSADASTQDANPANSGHYNYTITRTWTATDVTGNFSTCDQVITVNALHTAAVTVSPVNTINAKHQNHTIYLGYGPQSVTLAASAQGGVGTHTYSWSPVTGVANPTSAAAVVSPLASTTYTVTITDGSGCTIAQNMSVQVIDVRCGNKVKICHYPPGNPGNAQQQCLPASAIAAHLAHGCVLGDCPQNKNGESGEEGEIHGVENMMVTKLNVYPNPNNGAFTVELPAGMEQSEVVILDMAGRIIQKKTALDGAKLQFDLGPVARGVYMLHLTNSSQNFRTRISVQ
jgi:hypothetical protein